MLLSIWSGKYGAPVRHGNQNEEQPHKKCTDLQFSALQAMSALLCCGECFDSQGLGDDGLFYEWLDVMLGSSEEQVLAYACVRAGFFLIALICFADL